MGNSGWGIIKGYKDDHDNDDRTARRDRISELPDDLLHRILYHGGMKQAVQTSVLSWRWRDVWWGMPRLNFDASEFSRRCPDPNEHLFDFAERAMVRLWSHHAGRCLVRKIRFVTSSNRVSDIPDTFQFPTNYRLLSSWTKKVKTVVVGLEQLELIVRPHLYLPVDEPPMTVRCFLHPWMQWEFVVRSLELRNIGEHQYWPCIIREAGGFQLESLLIANCSYRCIEISLKELKVLKLWHCGNVNYPIQVFAPNLTSLDCRQIPCSRLHLETSPDTILDAVLDFTVHPYDTREAVNVIKLMGALRNVRSLTLRRSTVKCLNMQRDEFKRHLTFHNLKHVVLLSETSDQPTTVERNLFQRWSNLEAPDISIFIYTW